jgi:hypothetical protein
VDSVLARTSERKLVGTLRSLQRREEVLRGEKTAIASVILCATVNKIRASSHFCISPQVLLFPFVCAQKSCLDHILLAFERKSMFTPPPLIPIDHSLACPNTYCKPRAPCMVTWIIRQPISPPLHVYKLRSRASQSRTRHFTIHLITHFVSCSRLLTHIPNLPTLPTILGIVVRVR